MRDGELAIAVSVEQRKGFPHKRHSLGLGSGQLLGVCKPAGMPVHPSGAYRRNTLLHILATTADADTDTTELRPLHRLDRMTSGVVVMARGAAAARVGGEEIARGRTLKLYLALVRGDMRSLSAGERIDGSQSGRSQGLQGDEKDEADDGKDLEADSSSNDESGRSRAGGEKEEQAD
eukprot:COSAG04_NODE_13766_length_593_cov_0.674089_1_plen_176_part_10